MAGAPKLGGRLAQDIASNSLGPRVLDPGPTRIEIRLVWPSSLWWHVSATHVGVQSLCGGRTFFMGNLRCKIFYSMDVSGLGCCLNGLTNQLI